MSELKRGDEELRRSPTMSRLLEEIEAGRDVGHYGRLVFAIVARHFLPEPKVVALLAEQPGEDEQRARALVLQVKEHDYSPPSRDRILQWQSKQEFAICPDPADPDCGNLYRELTFPDGIYEHIEDYWEHKAESAEPRGTEG